MKKQLSFFLVFSCAVLTVSAQQRIGDASTGSKLPNKDAILELESKNKALLVSRIALSSTTVATPLSVHTAGMIAYNTATINDVVPGIYYNDGTKWLLVGKGETTNIKYDPVTNIISYIDGSGNAVTIDIAGIVRGSQTVTKVVAEVLDGKNTGKYTYYNEKDIDKDGNITGAGTVIDVVGDVQNNFQEIVNNTEVKQIFETIVKNTGGNVSYNATTNSFTYVDGTGTSQTINITDMVKGNETVTKLVAEVLDGKNTGKYTYYNEKDIDKDGNITGPGTVINVVGDVQNNFQEIVNNTEVKQIFETIVKNTSGNVSYNATTNSFTYVDGTGTTQTINITDMVKGNETVTKLVAEVLDGKNTGKYTYYNEKDIDKDGNITGPGTVINVVGDVQNNFQEIVNNTEVKQIFETIVKNTGGNVSYNATTNSFTYVDGTGTSQTINITDMVKGNETVTKLVAEVLDGKNTGKYTYYNEKDIDKDGNITGPGTVINVVGDVQNNFQEIVNNTEVKQIFETIVKNTGGNVSYNATTNSFTYVDGTGTTQTINITDMVKGNETVTKLVAEMLDGKNTGKYTYYNEKDIDKDGNITGPGTVINVVGDVQNNFQEIVNNTEVKQIFETIVKNTGGNVSYNATTNSFTYVDGTGTTQTINITDMVQNNQKTSSVTGTGLANVTSSTTGNNTNYTVDVTATAVQVAQKTSSVEGTATASVSSTVSGNNTAYTVSVPTASTTLGVVKEAATTPTVNIASDGTLSVNTTQLQANQKTSSVVSGTTTTVSSATTGNNTAYTVEINPSSVQNSQKLTTLSDGNITTVAATTTGNTTDYKVNVPTASTTLGVVKQATTAPTVDIASDGTLSVNTTQLQANQKTSSVTGTGLANVTSSTTGNNTNYTVDVTATAVQGVQKTSSVTKGDYTTVATTTPTTNNTDYKVDVDPSTLIGAGLKLNATTKKIDVDVTTIPNATDKTATVANGTNTTVDTDPANPNNPIYKVNVNNATAGATGAVKPGLGLAVAADGTLSVNTATAGGIGKTLNTDGIILVNGANTLASSVLADATLSVKDKSIAAAKLVASAADEGKVATVNSDGTVSYKAVSVGGATDGKSLTNGDGSIIIGGTTAGAGATLVNATVSVATGGITDTKIANDAVTTDKILDGTIVNADIANSTILPGKLANTTLPNQVLVSNGSNVPTWVNQNTLAVNNLYTSNGSLLGNREVNVNGHLLTFKSTSLPVGSPELRETLFDYTNGAYLKNATTTGRSVIRASSGGSIVELLQELNSPSQLLSSGTSTGLIIGSVSGSSTPLQLVTNGASRMYVAAGGNIGIGTALPSNALHVNATDPLRLQGLQAQAAVNTNQLIVADNTGVLKTLAAAGNNQVLTTSASGVPTWANQNALAVNNLYTSNGSLTADRAVDLNAKTLTFKDNIAANAGASTELSYTSGNAKMLHSATAATKSSEIILQANTSQLNIAQYPTSSQIVTSGTSPLLNVGTSNNAPMTLTTSSVTRMIVAANGNIGMGTGTALIPTNVLHVNATNPLRLEGLQAQAAVNTNQLIVADNTGVLKTLAAAGNNQVLTTSASGVPTWANQNALAVNNLYTSNGSLTADRTVDLNAHTLTFNNALSPAGKTTLTYSNANAARISHTTTTGTADIIVDAGGSTLNIFQNPNSASQITANGASTSLNIGTANTTPMTLTTSNLIRMHISDAGKVGIGTTNMLGTSNANVLLAVNGSIESANSTFADYVFEDYFKGYSELKKDYSFKSLKEVEKFINENKHLPGITSIKALRKNQRGEYVFNMSELSIQILEKVEELYLHTIEQQKQLDAKDKEIQDLKAQQQKTEERLKRLEEALLKDKK